MAADSTTVERALDELGVGGVLLHELGVAEDRLQQVVEVVGDAAGQLAERGELLRLVELALDLALGGDVAHDRDDAVEAALRLRRPDSVTASVSTREPPNGRIDLEGLALGPSASRSARAL